MQNEQPEESYIPEDSYIRVGTDYYKLIYKPMLSKDKVLIFKKWSYYTLKHDNIDLSKIKKYDDFIVMPDHINFQQEIGGFFNKYFPLKYKPATGSCDKIKFFLKHIFGEQLELGMDYLKILYLKPTQILPIFVLASEARNTGKTTFLNLLKAIYGYNMSINTNEDFRSQFNTGWASCLIIGIDEVLLDKKEDSERIKNLSTSRTYKEERKGVDKVEIEFFGKFILCSNRTKDFIKIDKHEIRYWVREIPTLNFDNKDLLEEMVAEIPQFLNYLKVRDFSSNSQSRMWFTPQQIWTEALDRVKSSTRSKLELELISIINIIMDTNNIQEVRFTLKDASDWLQHFNAKPLGIFQLKQIIQESWKLKPIENSSPYKLYRFNKEGETVEFKGKGRFYIYSFNYLDKN